MADIVRISEDGQICIVDSELDAVLEVVGNLVVTGTCTCGEETDYLGYMHTEYVWGGYGGGDSDGSRSRPWLTIQDAVSHCASHYPDVKNRIFIRESVYTEHVTIPPNLSLLFQGESRSEVIVQSSATWSPFNPPVFSAIEAPYSNTSLVFMEMTIRNGSHGIRVRDASQVTIERCELRNNGWSGSGLNVTDPSLPSYPSDSAFLTDYWNGPEVSNADWSAAVYLENVPDVQIQSNMFTNNLRGIWAVRCGSNQTFSRIHENIIASSLHVGVGLTSPTSAPTLGCENISVENTLVLGSGFRGISLFGGVNNRVCDCTVHSCWVGGIALTGVSDTLVEGCRLKNCTLGRYASDGSTVIDLGGVWEPGAVVVTGGSQDQHSSFYVARIKDCAMIATDTGVALIKRGALLGGSLHHYPNRSSVQLTGNHFTGFDIATHFLQGALTPPEGAVVVDVTHTDNVYHVGNGKNFVNDDHGSYVEAPYANLYPAASHNIHIHPKPCERSVLIEPNGNTFALNQLYATRKADNRIVIRENVQDGGKRIQFDDIDPCRVYIDGIHIAPPDCPQPSTASVNAVVDAINDALSDTCAGGDAPQFLGPFQFNADEGTAVNFIPAVSGSGITFTQNGLPQGFTLNSVTGLVTGTAPAYDDNGNNLYNWSMTATNAYGSDTALFTMAVLESGHSTISTRSVWFDGVTYGQCVQLTQPGSAFPMYKESWGVTNPSDAWTFSMWLKPNVNAANEEMGIFEYGLLRAKILGTGTARTIQLRIGTDYNNIEVNAMNALNVGSWQHVVFTYNGNACGVASDQVQNIYYRAFKIYVNGYEYSFENGTAVCTNDNYGYNGGNQATELNLGLPYHGLMDELILTPGCLSDVQVAALFNAGVPDDPRLLDPNDLWDWVLGSNDSRWWRMGDGTHPDAHPNLYDELHAGQTGGNYVLTMIAMVAANIVNEGAHI